MLWYNQQCNMTQPVFECTFNNVKAVICRSASRNMRQCNVFSCVNKHNQPLFTNLFHFQLLFRKCCFLHNKCDKVTLKFLDKISLSFVLLSLLLFVFAKILNILFCTLYDTIYFCVNLKLSLFIYCIL